MGGAVAKVKTDLFAKLEDNKYLKRGWRYKSKASLNIRMPSRTIEEWRDMRQSKSIPLQKDKQYFQTKRHK